MKSQAIRCPAREARHGRIPVVTGRVERLANINPSRGGVHKDEIQKRHLSWCTLNAILTTVEALLTSALLVNMFILELTSCLLLNR